MSAHTLRQRPIFGGVFGKGRYTLATVPCIARGLHSVRFMVVNPSTGGVLAVAEQKDEALSAARRLIRATAVLARAEAQDTARMPEQICLWSEASLPPIEPGIVVKKTSKRRREVFELSQGKCHYCATPLCLDGKWHIEHQMPKALGGSDHIVNLVAACVPCNLQKRDLTALEFVAARGCAH